MKICNGCKYLLCEKDDLIRDDNDNTVFCECRYDHRFEGHYIGWFDEGEPISTPDWCPKEEKMCNNHSINVQKEVLNVN